MDIKSRILQALVASAAGERPHAALDITRQGTAARTLMAKGVPCRRAPHDDEQYPLVICTMSTLPRLLPFVEPDGSLIVHIKPGQHGELLGMAGEYGLIASARTPTGAWLRLRRSGDSTQIPPRVSVVMALHNNASHLAQLLSTLEDQPTDPAWDLVVVDRGSRDATTDLLERVTGDLRRIRVSRDADPVDALYAGVRAARGDVIVPVPPGLAPSCGFVSALLRHTDTHPPSATPLFGAVLGLDGRAASGVRARAFSRPSTPTTPRRLAKWLTRTRGVEVPGFRLCQLVPGPVPSFGLLGRGPQCFESTTESESHAVLAQSRKRLEQGR